MSRSDIKTLFAFYDLKNSPITFDSLFFVAMSEVHRRARGFEKIQFIITLGENGSFRLRTQKDHALSDKQKIWRVRHVTMPSCLTVNSCTGVWLAEDRTVAQQFFESLIPDQIFPPGFTFKLGRDAFMLNQLVGLHERGHEIQVLRSRPEAREIVQKWITANKILRPVIVLSTRTNTAHPWKNSNLKAWANFADYADELGYDVVVIPDTELAIDGKIPRVGQRSKPFFQGALDFDLRVALYDLATITLSTHGGPAMFNALSYNRFCMFQGDTYYMGPKEFYRQWKVKWGDQLPWASAGQQIAYVADTEENIKAVFHNIVGADLPGTQNA